MDCNFYRNNLCTCSLNFLGACQHSNENPCDVYVALENANEKGFENGQNNVMESSEYS